MSKKQHTKPQDIKPDLKHDSMEFSAATDGDEMLDTDIQTDPDEISSEELNALEDDTPKLQDAALKTVEEDRLDDVDVNFEISDDIPDQEDEGEAARNHR